MGKTKTHGKVRGMKAKGAKTKTHRQRVGCRKAPEIQGPIAWLNQHKKTKRGSKAHKLQY